MNLTWDTAKRVVWTFIQAFLGAFISGLIGLTTFPNNWTAAKAFFASLVVAALAAGLSAVKNVLLGADHAAR